MIYFIMAFFPLLGVCIGYYMGQQRVISNDINAVRRSLQRKLDNDIGPVQRPSAKILNKNIQQQQEEDAMRETLSKELG